jgi:hypothetical protein
LWPCSGFPGGGVLDDEHCPHWQRVSLGLLTQHDLPAWGLPRVRLVAKHKTLTNLRVVRDQQPATGWTLSHEPFAGWETVPTW